MQSMTGYGHGEASNGTISIIVELRSVNSRFRDIQLRVPRFYLSLESRIKTRLQERISRGRLEVFVRREASDASHQITGNPQLAEHYLLAMQDITKRLLRDPSEIPLSTVLAQPGVLTSTEPEPDIILEWDIVSTALDSALADLLQMRHMEGVAILSEMTAFLAEFQKIKTDVLELAEVVNQRIHEKLQGRLKRLLDEHVEPNRLAQEGAILADKSDISEELLRLQSHCEQLGSCLYHKGPIGRKIDFILQELNREVNTIGSKSADSTLTRHVINMKSILEKLREQTANIE